MKQGYEMQFLIKLKTNIIDYGILISEFCEIDQNGEIGLMLNDFYGERIGKNQDLTNKQTNTKIVPENRFNFQQLKFECEGIDGIIGKQNILVNDCLILSNGNYNMMKWKKIL